MIDINALPDFLTVEEVAEILRLKRSTAYQYVHQGFIPAVKLGHFIRVPKARILEMVQTHKDITTGTAN